MQEYGNGAFHLQGTKKNKFCDCDSYERGKEKIEGKLKLFLWNESVKILNKLK